MSPCRFSFVVLLEALLWAPRCLSIRLDDTRLLEEIMQPGNDNKLVPYIVNAAEAGQHAVEDAACDDIQDTTETLLDVLDGQLDLLRPFSPSNWPALDVERVQKFTATLATNIMALDEKRCLKEAMLDEDTQNGIDELNSHRAQLFNDKTNLESNDRVQRAFARLASWQEALVQLGADMVDRDELYPRDLTDIMSCPRPCRSCSFKHNSLFKGKESEKFKCILDRSDRYSPPSRVDGRLSCEEPKRRMSKFWQFKTWCTAPGWVMDSFQNARIAAMVTCGTHSLLAALKTDEVMSEELMQSCMLAEQRMVVTIAQLQEYTQFMEKEDDGVVPLGVQYAFGAFVTTATAQGLVALRDSSTIVPPSDDSWAELLYGSGYTLVPPELVSSVPCKPPISRWEVLMGAFAAVVSIGSGAVMGVLATIPVLLLSGFFFVMALAFMFEGVRSVFGFLNLDVGFDEGIETWGTIPSVFLNTFKTTAKDVHNALTSEPVKACPRGLLLLSGTEPICIEDMDKLDAKRYTCPMDESRSVVVSCEPEFNGLPAIRGAPC